MLDIDVDDSERNVYVGMPIAVAFAKKGLDVIGFDLNKEKIELYKTGVEPTKEVGDEVIKSTTLEFTADETRLKEAKFIIVAVPTPVNTDHTPDLTPVIGASEIVGRNLSKGAILFVNLQFILVVQKMYAFLSLRRIWLEMRRRFQDWLVPHSSYPTLYVLFPITFTNTSTERLGLNRKFKRGEMIRV